MSYLLFFSSHFGHRKVLDRVQSAVSAGLPVHLICYDRFDIGMVRQEISQLCQSVNFIGTPNDGGKLSRILYWFFALKQYVNILLKHGFPSYVLVNNGEFLLFASTLYFKNAKKYFDLADINHVQYKSGFKSKTYRFLERLCLKRDWSLIVTSPWFYWDYFVKMQSVESKAYLIENKLTKGEFITLQKNPPRKFIGEEQITIGWTGVLRCSTSLQLLLDLCEKHPERYQIHLIGMIGSIAPEIVERAKSCNNFSFKGKYNGNELANFLKDVDFVWSADFDDGLNSKLLLPNRLYQAIAGIRPIIALAGSATGKVTQNFSVGLTFDIPDADSLHKSICNFQLENFEKTCISQKNLGQFMIRKEEFVTLFIENSKLVRELPKVENLSVMLTPE